MQRLFHIFIITCLLSLGLAEAGERVMSEMGSADSSVASEHVHHDTAADHDAGGDENHCADCCHAPCFWLTAENFRLPLVAGPLLARSSVARRFTSARPSSLFRPPIV